MEATTEILNIRVDQDLSATTELSLDQLDDVNGGILPVVLIAFGIGFYLGASSCAC